MTAEAKVKHPDQAGAVQFQNSRACGAHALALVTDNSLVERTTIPPGGRRCDMSNLLPVIYLVQHGETGWSLTRQYMGLLIDP